MARNKKPGGDERRAAADYYRLKTQAVDDLVSTDASNAPHYSMAELRKYRRGLHLNLADWLKAFLLKAWLAGAVCFFFLWGLGTYIPNRVDLLVVVGLALGVVTHLIVNPILRFYAPTPHGNDRWMLVSGKSILFLPLNVLYGFALLYLVVNTYEAINALLLSMTGATDEIPLGVGPILFGVFTAAWDFLFLGCKRLLGRIVADAKKQADTAR